MWLWRLRLLPTLIRSGMKAPRRAADAWENYWSGVESTGAGGHVLWDAASSRELAWCVERARASFDPALPVVDVGCGNGRYARALAAHTPSVVGVDVAERALEWARRETASDLALEYRKLDISVPGSCAGLSAELGESNVFVRGVFHVLERSEQSVAAANIAHLLGRRGTLFIFETAFPGGDFEYLEHLGATDGRLPRPLRWAVESGIPKPSRFDAAELERCFPPPTFRVLESGPAEIHAVGMRPGHETETIPGFYAMLRVA